MWINKLLYFSITLYAGLLTLLYQDVGTFYAFLLLVVCPVVLFGMLLYMKRKVEVRVKSSLTVVNKNQPVPCTVYIENQGVLPISCIRIIIRYQNQYGTESGTQCFTISMNAKSQQNINFTIQSEHVGHIRLKVEKVRIFDYLRIFSRKVPTVSEAMVTVLPEIYTIEQQLVVKQPDFIDSNTYSKVKSGDDPSEVFDIREYKEGDKLHRIHWKLSSKKEDILVKEYSFPIACSTAILVDLQVLSQGNVYGYMDALVSTIGSISYSLLLQEHMHYIAWYEQETQDYNTMEITTMEELYLSLSAILTAKTCTGSNEILYAQEAFSDSKNLTKMYYITSNLGEEKYEALYTKVGQAQVEVIQIVEEHTKQEKDDPFDRVNDKIHNQYISTRDCQSSIEGLLL